jgi:hypothetical protein
LELLKSLPMKTRLIKSLAIAGAILITFGSANTARADSPAEQKSTRSMSKMFDLLVVRPVGFAMTVAGTGLFIATLPATAISGDTKQAGDALIGHPAKIAFGAGKQR